MTKKRFWLLYMLPVILMVSAQIYLGFAYHAGTAATLTTTFVVAAPVDIVWLLFSLLFVAVLAWHVSGVIPRFKRAGISPWWCVSYLVSPLMAVGLIATFEMTILGEEGSHSAA